MCHYRRARLMGLAKYSTYMRGLLMENWLERQKANHSQVWHEMQRWMGFAMGMLWVKQREIHSQVWHEKMRLMDLAMVLRRWRHWEMVLWRDLEMCHYRRVTLMG